MVSCRTKVVGATEVNWDSMPPPVSHWRGEVGGYEVMLVLMLLYPDPNVSRSLATYVDGGR